MRIATLVLCFGLLGTALAEDKKTDKAEKAEKDAKKVDHPVGAYVKSANGLEITFEFKKDNELIFKMAAGDNGCTLTAKATYEKGGKVKCKTEKFEKQGDFPVEKEKGYEFSFVYKVDGQKVIISELDGSDINDEARDIVGGEYALKGDK